MRVWTILLITLALGFCSSGTEEALALDTAYSGNFIVVEKQSGFVEEQYEIAAGKKFQRGAENVVLGWLEVPHGVKSEIRYRRLEYLPVGIETVFIGAFKGFTRACARTAVGFYEMFTFLYPQRPIMQEMENWLY